MTATNFDRALSLVLVHEGGYVNHPADPGGATNKGVTTSTYNAYRRAEGLPTRSVRSITMPEVRDIYRSRYWNTVKGDDLPSGVDYAVFDFAVNSGPSRSAEFLQRIVGAHVDGVVGPMTLKAVAAYGDPAKLIRSLCDNRLAWLKRLKTWGTFGKGWANRVNGVRSEALKMVSASPAPPSPPVQPPPAGDGLGEPDTTEKPGKGSGGSGFLKWLWG